MFQNNSKIQKRHGGGMALKGLAVGVLSLAACASSHADVTLIAQDNFTGDGNGSIGGATGGTGWTSSWTLGQASAGVNWSVASSSAASYPGLTGSLGQMSGAAYNLYDDYRSLPLQNSGNVYVEILANYSDNGGNGYGQIRLGLNNPGGPPVAYNGYILTSKYAGPGYFATGGTWGIGVAGGSPAFGFGTTALGTQALLLEQINFKTDTTKLWVNPDLSTFNYVDPTATPDATVNAAGEFNDIEFLDVSGTVADLNVFSVTPTAAPEPSSLIGGGLILLAWGGNTLRTFLKKKQA